MRNGEHIQVVGCQDIDRPEIPFSASIWADTQKQKKAFCCNQLSKPDNIKSSFKVVLGQGTLEEA
jgi:hypothetical protein